MINTKEIFTESITERQQQQEAIENKGEKIKKIFQVKTNKVNKTSTSGMSM